MIYFFVQDSSLGSAFVRMKDLKRNNPPKSVLLSFVAPQNSKNKIITNDFKPAQCFSNF